MSSTEPLTVESLTLPLESGQIQRCRQRPAPQVAPGSFKEQTARTLIAMSAYNEEKYIAKTVTGSRRYADAVLAVDGGSKDDTVEIARALGAIVVQHEGNRGYGWALQTIFCTAQDFGAEERIVIDSDGQHNEGRRSDRDGAEEVSASARETLSGPRTWENPYDDGMAGRMIVTICGGLPRGKRMLIISRAPDCDNHTREVKIP